MCKSSRVFGEGGTSLLSWPQWGMSDRLSRMSRKTATDDVEKDDDDDIERTITRTL